MHLPLPSRKKILVVYVLFNAGLVFSYSIYFYRTGRVSAKEEEIRARVDTLNQKCSLYSEGSFGFQDIQKLNFKHIIVDEKNKVMFCYVPKVACTNFLRIFLNLNDKTNVFDPLHIKASKVHELKNNLTTLGSFSVQEAEYRMKNYDKVMFVREPLERVLSAFRNKFVYSTNDLFRKAFGKTIIKRYRHNSTQKDLNDIKITFTEFVEYLLDWRTIEHGYNDHWETYDKLCHPCLIRYNYIGKYESIEKDVGWLLKLLNIDDEGQFPKRDKNYKHTKSADEVAKFYNELKPEMLKSLVKIYSKDYALFNYNISSQMQMSQQIDN